MFPRVGEDGTVQLELNLFPDEPWGGHSPRGLTRVGLGLIFKARATEARVIFEDPMQMDLFPRRRLRLKFKS